MWHSSIFGRRSTVVRLVWAVAAMALLCVDAASRMPITRTEWYRRLNEKTGEVRDQLKEEPLNQGLRDQLVEHYEEYCTRSLTSMHDYVHPEDLMVFLRLCRSSREPGRGRAAGRPERRTPVSAHRSADLARGPVTLVRHT